MLRLTDKDINKLQNYFGIAIRDTNVETVYELKKAIVAVLYHCSDAETIEQRHQFCPPTETTWCKYQLDLIKGTSFYKNKPGIPEKIRKLLKPMFMALSDDMHAS